MLRREQQGQEATSQNHTLHCSQLSGPHLPLRHAAGGSGKMRHNAGQLEQDQGKGSGKVGAGSMVRGEEHNFKGMKVD